MRLSVIIPTLNEATDLARTLASVRAQKPYEVIVVDGGSTDATRTAAAAADRFLTAPRGRAVQMNAGAALATGDFFLFLHADCVLDGEPWIRSNAVSARRTWPRDASRCAYRPMVSFTAASTPVPPLAFA